ncbi:MAG: 50S ribosomal protein L18 [Legionellaceae bacterium]|nr:50S ribosomal protein L18 [Legionellaceae bacterium]
MSKQLANKKNHRIRRAKRQRAAIKRQAILTPEGVLRLTVHRSSRHIYAQVIDDREGIVKASASSLEKTFHDKFMGNVAGAKTIGALLAERAKKAGVKKVAFDRSGFKYHGRIKALADATREGGVEF